MKIKHEHHVLVTFQNPLVIQAEPAPAVLAEIKQLITQLIMTNAEAFESLIKSSDRARKAFAEVREIVDKQTVLIEELRNGKLTAAQEKVVTDLETVTQELDDIVPDAPPTEGEETEEPPTT